MHGIVYTADDCCVTHRCTALCTLPMTVTHRCVGEQAEQVREHVACKLRGCDAVRECEALFYFLQVSKDLVLS